MKIVEIQAKSILPNSKIYQWTINPYRGCQHACSYCYARFTKRFTHHRESWGNFVDAKLNAPGLLTKEVRKKKVGRVWISGVCDPYQPAEKEYELTRRCLKVLKENGWPVTIQTKSPLVLRDLDLLKDFGEIEVCFSIGTGNEEMRSTFEPNMVRGGYTDLTASGHPQLVLVASASYHYYCGYPDRDSGVFLFMYRVPLAARVSQYQLKTGIIER